MRNTSPTTWSAPRTFVPLVLRAPAVAALLLVTLGWPNVAAAEELIVDNGSDTTERQGQWAASTTTAGYYGANYLFRMPGDGTSSVWWPFPSAASTGSYEVFATWPSGPNRASDAPYQVEHASGTTTVLVNQQVNAGAWQYLGTFTFHPDQLHGIRLTDAADGVVVADAIRWVGPSQPPTPAPPPTPTRAPTPGPRASASLPGDRMWVVNFEPADSHAGPDASSDRVAALRQFTYLEVLGYEGAWAHVYDPRARRQAYVPSHVLGPSDPPPAWIMADPPPAVEEINREGRTIGAAPLALYPVPDEAVYIAHLAHNTSVYIQDTVRGEDGEPWYRTAEGDYLPHGAVRLPRTPPQTFSGKWIDVDLGEPALLTAYEDDRPVLSALTITGTGAFQTPVGVFTIQRRVANETMDSASIGIPRQAPGGYYLTDVLFTQYFLPTGESIHYNYWSGNFGYPGSHGCLGLNYADSAFLWQWASVGTIISIHD